MLLLVLSFGCTFFSVKFCCKKGWSYIFNFRTIYLCFAGYNESVERESNFILFYIFNYVPYIKPHPPSLILLLVNFGVPGENLVTSTIWFATKAQKKEEVCKVGHKNCKGIFGVEELSAVRKSSYVKSESETR